MKRTMIRAAAMLLVATGFPVIALQAPSQAADATRPADGRSQATAAGSCWEVKQNDPTANDGVYWLITPELGAPEQFYCDQTTDGGGWVLIGRGRQGWKNWYHGTGTPAQVRNTPAGTGAFAPAQLPSTTVDDLLNGQAVNTLTDGVRLRRAADVAGSSWNEVRFQMPKRTRWAWTFGAINPVGAFRFGLLTAGTGGTTASFGRDTSFNRVEFAESSNQGFLAGFAYGANVRGFNNGTSFLWSNTDNLGGARPFTQMYLRPQLKRDAMFAQSIPDTGTTKQEQRALPESDAQRTVWGVSGLANGSAGELNTEVAAFGQVGDRVYVGGNFATPQQDAAGTGAVNQPYLAAFDVNTGALVTSFRPALDNQVKAITAMPDGRVAVGGQFTTVNGQPQAGLALLDPETGQLSGPQVNVENRSAAGGAPSVRGLRVGGNHLYLSGAFTHLTQGTVSAAAWNGGRIVLATTRPDTAWNPTLNGTSVGLDYSPEGDRVYFSGYFMTVKNQAQPRVTAIVPAAGAAQAIPGWTASFSPTSTNTWQFGVQEIGSRFYYGGSEHSLFGYDRTTLQRQSGSITQNGGDFQTVTANQRYDAVFGGCHCGDWTYQDAYTWRTMGNDWTQADSIGTFGAWNAANGNYLPEFNPVVKGREGYGAWATFVDSRGFLWAGGDFRTSLRAGAVNQWSGGFMRFAPRDTQAPTRPTSLQSTGTTTDQVQLSWGASTDDNAGLTYEVLENNRVVATTTNRNVTLSRPEGDLRYFVRARDAAGNRSASTEALKLGVAPAPPAAPVVTAQAQSPTSVLLTWPDQAANAGFTVSRDGNQVATLPAGATQYQDTGLIGGTQYTYVVTARDSLGQSTASAPVQATTTQAPRTQNLIPDDASWRWRYEDLAPATDWAQPGFDASAWSAGAAPLGYGSAAITTDIGSTLTRKPLSAQFRHAFDVADVNSVGTLTLSVVADDGAIIYVNGTEVARRNVGTGTVAWNTFATAAPRTTSATASRLVVEVPRALLRNGTNVVAAQTHLNYRATPDVSFRLSLDSQG